MKLRKIAPVAAIAAATFALTACSGGDYGLGSSDEPAKAAAPASSAPAAPQDASQDAGQPMPPAEKKVLTVNKVEGFTEFVTNKKGRTIYRFDLDEKGGSQSACQGACAQIWEPVLVESGVELASPKLDPSLIGSIVRPEGKQVTLNGWPLYYFKTDKELGQTEGHGKNGTWFAIAPNGKKAQKVSGEAAGTGSTGGNNSGSNGGYSY